MRNVAALPHPEHDPLFERKDEMSQWTHVNGNIRFDAMVGLIPNQDRAAIEKVMGKTCRFDDERAISEACTVPCGREGSIQYEIYQSPDPHELAAYSVSIFGDLRDYNNLDEIKKWFEKIITTWAGIRSAVLVVEIEYSKTVILIPREDHNEYKIVGVKEIIAHET